MAVEGLGEYHLNPKHEKYLNNIKKVLIDKWGVAILTNEKTTIDTLPDETYKMFSQVFNTSYRINFMAGVKVIFLFLFPDIVLCCIHEKMIM